MSGGRALLITRYSWARQPRPYGPLATNHCPLVIVHSLSSGQGDAYHGAERADDPEALHHPRFGPGGARPGDPGRVALFAPEVMVQRGVAKHPLAGQLVGQHLQDVGEHLGDEDDADGEEQEWLALD